MLKVISPNGTVRWMLFFWFKNHRACFVFIFGRIKLQNLILGKIFELRNVLFNIWYLIFNIWNGSKKLYRKKSRISFQKDVWANGKQSLFFALVFDLQTKKQFQNCLSLFIYASFKCLKLKINEILLQFGDFFF